MNAFRMLAAIGFLTVAAPMAHAAPVTINRSGAVTSVTGGNLSEGYAPVIAPGSPVAIGITIDPVGFTALQVFQASPFQISLGFTGRSALIQTCCIDEAASDLDPTDGAITLRGFLAGFTGAAVGPYTTSAGAFAITFRVFGSDVPLAPFATGGDVLSFFSAASLSLNGFARQNFNPVGIGSAFSQDVNFVGGVPLPAAAWMFLAGLGAFATRRRVSSSA